VVAAPLRTSRAHAGALLGTLLAAAFLIGMALTGASPELASLVRFEPAGVMAETPEEITRVELRSDRQALVFTRDGDRWLAGGSPLSATAVEHMTKALRFLHVSAPTTTLEGDGLDPTALAEMGLETPDAEVVLFAGDERALSILFGGVNPTRTAQYAIINGQAVIHLFPLHVGREWQVLARAAPQAAARAQAADARPGSG
jgi:hypothetical protein